MISSPSQLPGIFRSAMSGAIQSINRIPTIGVCARPLGFLAHPPGRRQANAVFDERLLGAGVNPRVNRLVANRAVSVRRSIHGGQCATRLRAGGALIWRGVCPWDKSAITRRRRTSSQSNRRFFGRRLAARAALPASSARYRPSGPVWRAISRHTTEGLRPIKWAIRVLDKPVFTPAMIAARSQPPSIRRHPMISLQTASPLHENCLHPMTPPTPPYLCDCVHFDLCENR